jgi:hypothetical protein
VAIVLDLKQDPVQKSEFLFVDIGKHENYGYFITTLRHVDSSEVRDNPYFYFSLINLCSVSYSGFLALKIFWYKLLFILI